METQTLAAIDRAIAALTYDHIERIESYPLAGDKVTTGEEIPLLQRSIGQDLLDIERMLGLRSKGRTILSAIASSIDEALLALEEARAKPGRDLA